MTIRRIGTPAGYFVSRDRQVIAEPTGGFVGVAGDVKRIALEYYGPSGRYTVELTNRQLFRLLAQQRAVVAHETLGAERAAAFFHDLSTLLALPDEPEA